MFQARDTATKLQLDWSYTKVQCTGRQSSATRFSQWQGRLYCTVCTVQLQMVGSIAIRDFLKYRDKIAFTNTIKYPEIPGLCQRSQTSFVNPAPTFQQCTN